MAVLLEMDEEELPKAFESGSSLVVGPYDGVLKSILKSQTPFSFLELMIDFLHCEFDLFEDEAVEKKILPMVFVARKKYTKKRKAASEKCAKEKKAVREKFAEEKKAATEKYAGERKAEEKASHESGKAKRK